MMEFNSFKDARVIVMSRPQFVQYASENQDETSYVISISTPGDTEAPGYASENNKIKEILRLKFFDSDREFDNIYPGMQQSDALEVANFIMTRDIKSVDKIIVHCDAGQSRSAGVAAALLYYFKRDDSDIYDNHKYFPNRLCYKNTLNALMNYTSESD